MIQPGMVVKHRVSWITAQKPQLVVEQNRRKRQCQQQIREHEAETDRECRNGHQKHVPRIIPTDNARRRNTRCISLVRTAWRTARQRWRALT